MVMNEKKEIDLLANRLNYDAVIFKGCTMNELLVVAGICIGISCTLLAIVVQILFGNFIYGLACGFALGGGFTYFACGILEKFRRGQEKGYIQQLVVLKLDKLGFPTNKEVIRRSGSWMIGRFVSTKERVSQNAKLVIAQKNNLERVT
jgi:conjugative transfer region protein (TIGR03750 family)